MPILPMAIAIEVFVVVLAAVAAVVAVCDVESITDIGVVEEQG